MVDGAVRPADSDAAQVVGIGFGRRQIAGEVGEVGGRVETVAWKPGTERRGEVGNEVRT